MFGDLLLPSPTKQFCYSSYLSCALLCYSSLVTMTTRETSDISTIQFNISGHHFTTAVDTLLNFPHTKLGELASKTLTEQSRCSTYFFDADEEVFKEVLRFHRTGELHAPRDMCYQSFIRNLEFWNIDKDLVSPCCRPEKDDDEMEAEFQWFERRVDLPDELTSRLTTRWHLWNFLTDPLGPHTKLRKLSIAWTMLYASITIAQSLVVGMQSLSHNYTRQFSENATVYNVLMELGKDSCLMARFSVEKLPLALEWKAYMAFVVFFLIEIAIRLISCPDRTFFMRSLNLMDLAISMVEFFYVVLFVIIFKESEIKGAICDLLNISAVIMFVFTNLRVLRVLSMAMLLR